jgi:adenylate cyclase
LIQLSKDDFRRLSNRHRRAEGWVGTGDNSRNETFDRMLTIMDFHLDGRRFDQAEAHSELALVMNPNDPRIVAQRGELLTWLGRPDEGAEWIEKALRVDPFAAAAAAGWAHLLVRAFYTARRYAEAIDAFRKIVSPSYMNLAEAAARHARIDDQVRANALAAATLRLNPDFAVARFRRGPISPWIDTCGRGLT